jgi:hypothetical protein
MAKILFSWCEECSDFANCYPADGSGPNYLDPTCLNGPTQPRRGLTPGDEMKKYIEEMKRHTNLWPWYWLSYGEKCYAFAVVEAYQANEIDPLPRPGTELEMDEDGDWRGENGTRMIIESEISKIEQQNGDTICSFIAAAHAYHLFGDCLKSIPSGSLIAGVVCPQCGGPVHTVCWNNCFQHVVPIVPTYETIEGKWWMFNGSTPLRELSDKEAALVIWGAA